MNGHNLTLTALLAFDVWFPNDPFWNHGLFRRKCAARTEKFDRYIDLYSTSVCQIILVHSSPLLRNVRFLVPAQGIQERVHGILERLRLTGSLIFRDASDLAGRGNHIRYVHVSVYLVYISHGFTISPIYPYMRFFRRRGWTDAQASRNLSPSTGTRRTVTFPLLIDVTLTMRFPIIYLRFDDLFLA